MSTEANYSEETVWTKGLYRRCIRHFRIRNELSASQPRCYNLTFLTINVCITHCLWNITANKKRWSKVFKKLFATNQEKVKIYSYYDNEKGDKSCTSLQVYCKINNDYFQICLLIRHVTSRRGFKGVKGCLSTFCNIIFKFSRRFIIGNR